MRRKQSDNASGLLEVRADDTLADAFMDVPFRVTFNMVCAKRRINSSLEQRAALCAMKDSETGFRPFNISLVGSTMYFNVNQYKECCHFFCVAAGCKWCIFFAWILCKTEYEEPL